MQELRGERIDIVPWSPDPARYVCSALSPAQVSKVIIDDAEKSMDVIVPDDQLSLAIGRKGQNVRLAVQLTGWRIDIKSETKMRELAGWISEAMSVVPGCGDPEAELLLQQGITSLEDLAACQPDLLTSLPGIDEAGALAIKEQAAELAVRKRAEEEEAARLEAERLEAERLEAERVAAERLGGRRSGGAGRSGAGCGGGRGGESAGGRGDRSRPARMTGAGGMPAGARERAEAMKS